MKRLPCLVILVALLAGCPRQVDDALQDGVHPEDLIIGLIQPLPSGSELAREQAARLAVQEINAAGGINGRHVGLLVAYDDDNDATAGVAAAQSLVDRGAVAIVGANASRVTLPIAQQVTIDVPIALVAHGATSPLISELDDHDTVFRVPPSDALQGRLLAQKVFEEALSTAALIHQSDAYGEGLRDAFVEAYTSYGGTLTTEVSTPTGKASGFASEIDAIHANGEPEALIIFGFGDMTTNLLRELLASKGSLPRLFGVDGNLNSGTLENAPVQTAGMRGTTPGAALDRAEYLTFARNFENATGMPVMDPNVGNTYDGVYLVALALAQAGTNSREAVIAHLRDVSIANSEIPVTIGPGDFAVGVAAIANGDDVDYQGVGNDIDFDARGDPTAATYQYVEVVLSDSMLELRVLETVNLP